MPLVNAKCTNCGANLKIDNKKEAAICEHCGSAFIVEKAINNYNTYTTVNADTVIMSNKNEMEKERLLKNAKTQEKLNEFNKAMYIYEQVAEDYPDDYRGWLGLVRIKTGNYDFVISKDTLNEVEGFIEKALAVMPESLFEETEKDWNSYKEKLLMCYQKKEEKEKEEEKIECEKRAKEKKFTIIKDVIIVAIVVFIEIVFSISQINNFKTLAGPDGSIKLLIWYNLLILINVVVVGIICFIGKFYFVHPLPVVINVVFAFRLFIETFSLFKENVFVGVFGLVLFGIIELVVIALSIASTFGLYSIMDENDRLL